MPTPTPVKIQTRFKYFNKDIRDIWESFHLVDFYMNEIHDQLQRNIIALLTYVPIWSNVAKTASRQDVFGAVSHLTRKVNPRRVVTDGVAAFEDFIGDIVALVYRDYPQKLL